MTSLLLFLMLAQIAPIQGGQNTGHPWTMQAGTNAGTRSRSVRRQFQRLHPCPSTQKRSGTCPGYVVDHIIPLACGGADSVLNLQWQTVKAAKLKDKTER